METFSSVHSNADMIVSELIARFSERLSSFSSADAPLIIAIDGRCASGKTTLSHALKSALEERFEGISVALFHMDDFYLRVEQRTEARYAEPGGNVDRERFKSEVLLPLKAGAAFCYHPFDCLTMALSSPVLVDAPQIAIVEGSYSLHPELIESYDLRIFMTVDHAEQQRRILHRNGEEKLAVFNARWIPLEEAYFDFYGVSARSDILIEN